MILNFRLLAMGAVVFGIPGWAAGSLTITLDFSDFGSGAWSSLHNDAWDGTTGDGEKQVAAEIIVESAAAYWEMAYVSSTTDLSVTISVGWAPLSGGTLATGSASWFNSPPDYPFASNALTFDSDGSSNFFADLTPTENSEWTKTSERTADLGGGTVNVERVHYNADTSGAAFNNADMLSVAIHEIGHSLGFLGSYPKYANLDAGGDGDLDLTDGTQVIYSGGHLTYSTTVPEPPSATTGFPADGYGISGTYYPMVMGPSIVTGTRKLLTEVDIRVLADVHGFDNLDTNPQLVPEPGVALLVALAVGGAGVRRRRASTTGTGVPSSPTSPFSPGSPRSIP